MHLTTRNILCGLFLLCHFVAFSPVLAKPVLQFKTEEHQMLFDRANAGDPNAQMALASLIEKGRLGWLVNRSEAVFWFELAAEQSLPEAYYELARIYEEGYLVERDNQAMVSMLEKAGELGLAKAYSKLSLLAGDSAYSELSLASVDEYLVKKQQVLTGESVHGVEISGVLTYSSEETMESLLSDFAAGDNAAGYRIAERYKDGIDVATDAVEACNWYGKALDNGHVDSYQDVVDCLVAGKPTDDFNSPEAAIARAAQLQEFDVDSFIGEHYYLAVGVEQDYERARIFFERSADNVEDYIALNNLGVIYRDGLGVQKDYQRAKAFFERSARQELSLAKHNLGLMYLQGLGVNPDEQVAYKLIKEAAAYQDDGATMYDYARMRLLGIGTEQDFFEALKWFRLSRSYGDNRASCVLDKLAEDETSSSADLTRDKEIIRDCGTDG